MRRPQSVSCSLSFPKQPALGGPWSPTHPAQKLAATGDDKTTATPEVRATPPRRSPLAGIGVRERRARKRCPDFRFRCLPGREEGAALSSPLCQGRRQKRRGAGPPLLVAMLFAFGFDDRAGAIQGFSNFGAHARVLPTFYLEEVGAAIVFRRA